MDPQLTPAADGAALGNSKSRGSFRHDSGRADRHQVELSHPDLTLPELAAKYQSNQPYPHLVFDDVLPIEVARRAAAEFDELPKEHWNYYGHYTDKSFSCMGNAHLPPQLGEVVAEFHGPRVVSILERLSGVEGLLPDPDMLSCGMLIMLPGQYKLIHTDYQIHSKRPRWLRRVNILLYFNEGWTDAYNGHFVLGDPDRSTHFVEILPILNRCVVFTTTRETLHGVPDTIACPDGMTRKVLMLQYYTEEKRRARFTTSIYRARRSAGPLARLVVPVENALLWLYWFAKRQLGISDRPAGVVFSLLGRARALFTKKQPAPSPSQ